MENNIECKKCGEGVYKLSKMKITSKIDEIPPEHIVEEWLIKKNQINVKNGNVKEYMKSMVLRGRVHKWVETNVGL